MNHWTPQEDGSVLGVATERAVQWSGDDHERIAAVAFVAWCRDAGLEPEWFLDDWRHVSVTLPLDTGPLPLRITVLLDQSDNPETFQVGAGLRETRYAVVRVWHSAGQHVVLILGMTGILDQIQRRFDGATPRSQLLTPRHWFPTPEAAA